MTSTTSRTRTPSVLLAVVGGALAATVVAYLVMNRLKGTSLQRIHARCATWSITWPTPVGLVILAAMAPFSQCTRCVE